MKTLYSYLVKPHGGRYNNEKHGLIINSTIDEKDYKHVNRIAEVIATPASGGLLQEGDLVIVHHNVFRKWWNVTGKLSNGGSYVKKDQYSLYEDQIFAYNRGDGWISTEDYCFVEPFEKDDDILITYVGKEALNEGKIAFSNPILASQGVNEGDTVVFSEGSEYEFNIDGKKLYKMSAQRDILAVKE